MKIEAHLFGEPHYVQAISRLLCDEDAVSGQSTSPGASALPTCGAPPGLDLPKAFDFPKLGTPGEVLLGNLKAMQYGPPGVHQEPLQHQCDHFATVPGMSGAFASMPYMMYYHTLNSALHAMRVPGAFGEVLPMHKSEKSKPLAAMSPEHMGVFAQSFDRNGTWTVQKRLRSGDKIVQEILLQQLVGCGVAVMTHIAAHHVAEVIVEELPSEALAEVLLKEMEMEGAALTVATDKFGCRVLVRMIRHCKGYSLRDRVIEKLIGDASQLICSDFGCIALEAIVEHGDGFWRHMVYRSVRGRMRSLAKQKAGSHVIQRVLRFCNNDQDEAAQELLGDLSWAKTPGGRYVHKELQSLRPELPSLKTKECGSSPPDTGPMKAEPGKVPALKLMSPEERQAMFTPEQWLAWLGPPPAKALPQPPKEDADGQESSPKQLA